MLGLSKPGNQGETTGGTSMFNDRFNDRVRRCRLTALLVLAVLVLFGLGAGHLATRALAAAPAPIPAIAVFGDRSGDGLLSDGGGRYETDPNHCVWSRVSPPGFIT